MLRVAIPSDTPEVVENNKKKKKKKNYRFKLKMFKMFIFFSVADSQHVCRGLLVKIFNFNKRQISSSTQAVLETTL